MEPVAVMNGKMLRYLMTVSALRFLFYKFFHYSVAQVLGGVLPGGAQRARAAAAEGASHTAAQGQ